MWQRGCWMKSLEFYIVDVFAEEKYAGNQLAVVRDAGALSSVEMQRIAREMHFSETTFILSDEKRGGGYDVRIFSPEKELPFAGHPTLGTAYVIEHEIVKRPVDKIVLNLKVGQISVTFSRSEKDAEVLWMEQVHPTFGDTFDAQRISEVLNLDAGAIDSRFPIQEVSTGVFFVIIPLRTLRALKQATISKDKYLEFIKDIQSKALLVFSPETHSGKHDLSVRVFCYYYGIPEDPATGSANGCLAAYLVKHRYFGTAQINIQVEQGYEIGRPSLLLLKSGDNHGIIDVHVGGKVVEVARGKLV
jgi:trans-2,3-dihydro-3-hydroxyanthranilate isomerase